nr:sigma-54 dependent transcriptional regulator [Halorhodospira neutriphila]
MLVEDDADLAGLLSDELTEAGYAVTTLLRGEEAEPAVAQGQADLVLCDLRLPGMSGMELLKRVTALPDPPAFLLITAFGTIPQAVEALKLGADDFLTKPLDLEHLRLRVARTLEHLRLRREIEGLRHREPPLDFHGFIGQSPAMRELYEQIRLMAKAGGAVLIEGESGSGKELAAQAVHAESPRAEGPFVAVNCASIPAELMESELFGHRAGAFTGAANSRRGLFTEADGGTLFLDEIGEMPTTLQANLLRALQEGRFRPVGEDRERTVDVRVVAATNRDLEEAVAMGTFREDLYYRLETFRLRVPPLRERGEDLELLTSRFMAQLASQLQRGTVQLSEDALACLRGYSFPGNVRELRNALERAVTLARGNELRCADLPERMQRSAPAPAQAPVPAGAGEGAALLGDGLPTLEELQQRYVDYVLQQVGGNKRQAARILGISRRTLYRRTGG